MINYKISTKYTELTEMIYKTNLPVQSNFRTSTKYTKLTEPNIKSTFTYTGPILELVQNI